MNISRCTSCQQKRVQGRWRNCIREDRTDVNSTVDDQCMIRWSYYLVKRCHRRCGGGVPHHRLTIFGYFWNEQVALLMQVILQLSMISPLLSSSSSGGASERRITGDSPLSQIEAKASAARKESLRLSVFLSARLSTGCRGSQL